MNHVMSRVRPQTPELLVACEEILRVQSDAALLPLVQTLKGHPKAPWKDGLDRSKVAWKDSLSELAAQVG
jgi:hypothetical protein